MRRYEYRLITLLFDPKSGTYLSGHVNVDCVPLQPGERVLKVMGEPEYLARGDGNQYWHVVVLAEQETSAFTLHDIDPDKLNHMLKGGK